MNIPQQSKVYIAIGATDMRKSINGLCQLVADNFGVNVFSDNLFAFCDRCRDIIKILFWDHNGFCIWYKSVCTQVGEIACWRISAIASL